MNNPFEKEAEGVAGEAEGAAHSSGQTMQEVVPRKTSKWIWILPIGCLGVLLCCGGGIFGLGMYFALPFMEELGVAKDTIVNSEQVQEMVGVPVTVGDPTSQRQEQDGEKVQMFLVLPIEGDKGSGEAEVELIMNAETWEWSMESIKVTVDGETVDITDEGDFTLDIDDLGE